MSLGGKSILEATTKDFIDAGFYTRKSLAKNGLPTGSPCRGPHKWDLAEEERKLYLYCTVCQHTEELSRNPVKRSIIHAPNPDFGSFRL